MPDSVAARFKPGLYITLVAVAALTAYGYTLRKDGIFSCPASGYGPDSYLAYCETDHYGDYDHGALWFDLEPGIGRFLSSAQVLFLGNSRMQFGFSSDTTSRWFASHKVPYYLMGFAYWENYQFEWPLMKRIKPNPKVYIVNMDLFFGTVVSGPAASVMNDSNAVSNYRRKRLWQFPHRALCSSYAQLCGDKGTFYRSVRNGEYTRSGGTDYHDPVSYDMKIDDQLVADYVNRGREFFASLPIDRECILITLVPSKDTHYGTTKAIADALGLTLIAPQPADLTMFDHSHLDRPSAERWSQAFFEAAGPQIRKCLNRGTGAEG
jgi:hypothetical protein